MAKKDEVTQGNLRFYDLLRQVPQHALKEIGAGRLKGMSDINPVWRIKAMTEAFGPCGIGWKYEITKQWQEQYGDEVKSFTNVNLYVRVDGEWSEPIPGTGGATLVELNSKGSYVNDEGFKMSLTDALSVAMKALGVAADVYFSKDKQQFETKYQQPDQPVNANSQPVVTAQPASANVLAAIAACKNMEELMNVWYGNVQLQQDKQFREAWAQQRRKVEPQQEKK